MNKEALCEARGRLEAFVDPLLPLLGRLERRRWGAFYIQGLLLEGGRKTAAGMAERYGGNEQALQQFVSQSPWDWMAVRRELAAGMAREAGSRVAWVLDDTGFPKKGSHSVGVARQYSGTLGKVGNCQIGVSLNYATDEGCFPIDFQLYLPQAWAEDESRRGEGADSGRRDVQAQVGAGASDDRPGTGVGAPCGGGGHRRGVRGDDRATGGLAQARPSVRRGDPW